MLNSGEPTQIYSNSDKTPISPIPTPPNLGQIFIDPKESHPTLVRSGQISAKNERIGKLETNQFPPENRYDTTRPDWSETSGGSVAGRNLPHPIMSGWVRVGHKPNPWTPLDMGPTCYKCFRASSFLFSFFFFLLLWWQVCHHLGSLSAYFTHTHAYMHKKRKK